MAIQGEGFFQIRRPDGTIAYSRDGSLKLSADGMLVTGQGYPVEPQVTLPAETTAISIGREGLIEATTVGSSLPVKVGQFELAKFVNPAGLSSIGNNLYVETAASGAPILGSAGSEGFGEMLQGQLEASNVDVVEEMVNMITAQRAYEINSKTVQTVDNMLSIATNLRR